MSHFVQLNGFERGPEGVFRAEGSGSKFEYSDGEDTEKRLEQILSDASDLSSGSSELVAQIVDWPTEYHLSSVRANLLRCLSLTGVSRILELGCGCGSITRFLAEQPGVEVDAVEGSPVRASLAALRCRDLDNVTVSTANFNEVMFPKNHYDLVLFVGVTEYAGRFSKQSSDNEALQDLLALGRKTAKGNGVVLVAIENRLGLKYLMGAHEDHYAQRYVGIDNYPQPTGIRTYSKPEWVAHIKQAGFAAAQFLYPFPDYKVPTVVLNDAADKGLAVASLKQVASRDYLAPFSLGESEYRAWQGLIEADNLGDHANSFLILMSDDGQRTAEMTPKMICQFDAPSLTYLSQTEEPGTDALAAKQQIIQRLRHDIGSLQRHADELERALAQIRQSIGWRIVSFVRRLLGRNKS